MQWAASWRPIACCVVGRLGDEQCAPISCRQVQAHIKRLRRAAKSATFLQGKGLSGKIQCGVSICRKGCIDPGGAVLAGCNACQTCSECDRTTSTANNFEHVRSDYVFHAKPIPQPVDGAKGGCAVFASASSFCNKFAPGHFCFNDAPRVDRYFHESTRRAAGHGRATCKLHFECAFSANLGPNSNSFPFACENRRGGCDRHDDKSREGGKYSTDSA
jgi:hypothetical protein